MYVQIQMKNNRRIPNFSSKLSKINFLLIIAYIRLAGDVLKILKIFIWILCDLLHLR